MSQFTNGMEPFIGVGIDQMGEDVTIGNNTVLGIYSALTIAERRMMGGRARDVQATLVMKRTDYDTLFAASPPAGPRARVTINGEKLRVSGIEDDDTNSVTLNLSPRKTGTMPGV
tara:strand:+ start:159 stop:503 length:345 start_codon:yes stop_codon:yes gene_type:complete